MAALRAAVNALVARHEALRTTFVVSEGEVEPVQRIADSLWVDVPLYDVEEHDIAAQVAAHARHVFDLGQGPLLAPEQAVVLETDPEKARAIARNHMRIYLGLPNYTNNLRRMGFSDEDIDNGGSDRLVDAIVAWGDIDTVVSRVKAHHDAGADHVCLQVFGDDVAGQLRALAKALL